MHFWLALDMFYHQVWKQAWMQYQQLFAFILCMMKFKDDSSKSEMQIHKSHMETI